MPTQISSVALLACLALPAAGRDDPVAIEIGDVVEGTLSPEDPRFTTASLACFPFHGDLPSDSYWFVLEQAGPYTIAVESLEVGIYLHLEDLESGTVQEQLEALTPADTQLGFDGVAGHDYRLVVGALSGDQGAYRLRVTPGKAEALSPGTLAERQVARARAAVEHAEAKDGARHVRTARSLRELGRTLNALGRSQEALPFLERAIEILEVEGAGSAALADVLSEAATSHYQQERYVQARALMDRALAIREVACGKNAPEVAQSHHEIGLVQESLGQFGAAEASQQQALRIAEADLPPDHRLVLDITGSLGSLLLVRGQYERALPILEREVDRVLHAPASADDRLGALRLLACDLELMGQCDRARSLAEQALAIGEQAMAADHPSLWPVHLLLGQIGRCERQYQYGLRHLERALAIVEAALGPESAGVASVLTERSSVLLELERRPEAIADLERALAIAEHAYGPRHPNTLAAMNNLAVAYGADDRSGRGKELLERVIALGEEVLGPEHPSTASAIANLAFAVSESDPERALSLARKSMTATRRVLERQLPLLSESERFARVAMQRSELDHVLTLTDRAPEIEDLAAVYRDVVEWKGLVSRGLLQERRWLQRQTDPATLADMRRLEQILSSLAQETLAAVASPGQRPGADAERLADEREAIERRLAARTDRVALTPSVDPARLQRQLAPDEAMLDFVEYHSVAPPSKAGVHAVTEIRTAVFVVRREGPIERIELGPTDAIERAAQAHRQVTSRCQPSSPLVAANDSPAAPRSERPAPRGLYDAARRLSEPLRHLVWEPVASRLDGVHRVFVVPDGGLVMVPLQTLPASLPSRILIEDYDFVYLQSALELLPDSGPEPATEILLVGGIDYERAEGAASAVAGAGSLRNDGARPASRKLERLEPLPGTLAEVEALAALHDRLLGRGKGTRARLLTGSDATEDRVKRLAPGARFLHLATHGLLALEGNGEDGTLATALATLAPSRIRPRDGMMPGIATSVPGLLAGVVLAGANRPLRPPADDGILTAAEAAWLDLRGCELVTLSACDTGVGTPQVGENLMGLRRGFRLAGARATLTSLWKVPDDATRELMIAFYRRLWAEHEPKSTALREAQLEQLERSRRQNGGEPMPGTWGAFVLEGDWH